MYLNVYNVPLVWYAMILLKMTTTNYLLIDLYSHNHFHDICNKFNI